MKKILVVLFFPLLLTGCDLDGEDTPRFPDVPLGLLEACPSLKNIPPSTAKLSEVLTVVTDNYYKYHDCRAKVDFWIEWYKLNKKIVEGK